MEAVIYRLWAMSLQASILILIVLAVRLFLGKYPRIYSYCLWILVGIRLLCPVWVESPFSLQPDLSGYSDRIGQSADNNGLSQTEIISWQGQDGAMDMNINTQNGEQQDITSGVGQPEEMLSKNSSSSEGEGSMEPEALPEQPGFLAGLKRMLERGSIGEYGFFTGRLNEILSMIYLIGVVGFLLFHFAQYLWMRHRVAALSGKRGIYGFAMRLHPLL